MRTTYNRQGLWTILVPVLLASTTAAQLYLTPSGTLTNAAPRVPMAQMNQSLKAISAAEMAAATNTISVNSIAETDLTSIQSEVVTMESYTSGSFSSPQHIGSVSRLLNVDMASSPSSKWGPAATGAGSGDFWNPFWYPNSTQVTVQNLLWSDQANANVSMTVLNAPGGWGLSVPDPMYNSYSYGYNGQNLVVMLVNLPPGTYDLFLYGHAPADYANSVFRVSAGSRFAGRRGTSIWSPYWSSSNWEEGIQYVRYRRLSVSAGEDLRIEVEPDANGYAVLNGFQVVPSDALLESALELHRLININFGGGTQKTGPAAFGQSSSDVWNWYYQPNSTYGRIPDMVWADGNSSQVSLEVANAPGAWGFSCSDPMYGNYIYPYSGPMEVTITNLPGDVYDICVYAHTPSEDDNSVVELWRDSILLDTRGTSLWGTQVATADFQEGQQYVVFRGVEVQPGSRLRARIHPGARGYAVLNGMQLLLRLDRDADGLPDWWEVYYFGDLDQTGVGDFDADGLSNLGEFQTGTNPTQPDQDLDQDGVDDRLEVLQGRNPNQPNCSPDLDNSIHLEVFTTAQ